MSKFINCSNCNESFFWALESEHVCNSNFNVPTNTGIKHDQEKPDYSLFSPLALEEVVKVLTFGKKKYTAHNWRGGIVNSRLFAAAMRHLWAYWRGENVDPESNLPHLAHAGCCIMMMIENTLLRPELDDRWGQNE